MLGWCYMYSVAEVFKNGCGERGGEGKREDGECYTCSDS